MKNWGISFLITIIMLELSPYILGRIFLQKSFSRKEIRQELKAAVQKTDTLELPNESVDGYLGDHILHPYLGFVSIPHPNYNAFNLPGENPVTKKAPDVLNVVIMGGSVAKDVYTYTGERIKQKLRTVKTYTNRKINLVVFALGGFKQPQQLIALNYFMAMGAEYDIVINIDGFNEVVLPFADNLPNHVFPSYPRHWNIYSRKKLDSKVMLVMGKQAVTNERIRRNKAWLAGSIFQNSNFALFIWKVAESKHKASIADLEIQLRNIMETSETDYQSTGIYTTVTDTLSFFREQAEFWRRSSRQIAQLGQSAGFEYFHFLQPNQYDEGSKTLTEQEMNIAFESGPFAYKDGAKIAYPHLREQGIMLKKEGVNFTDLSLLFKNEKRTVYNDKCCHFNQLGYEMIADQICREILFQVKD